MTTGELRPLTAARDQGVDRRHRVGTGRPRHQCPDHQRQQRHREGRTGGAGRGGDLAEGARARGVRVHDDRTSPGRGAGHLTTYSVAPSDVLRRHHGFPLPRWTGAPEPISGTPVPPTPGREISAATDRAVSSGRTRAQGRAGSRRAAGPTPARRRRLPAAAGRPRRGYGGETGPTQTASTGAWDANSPLPAHGPRPTAVVYGLLVLSGVSAAPRERL